MPCWPTGGSIRELGDASWSPKADIAVCETAQFSDGSGRVVLNRALTLSVLDQRHGEPVSTQFFHDADLQPNDSLPNEKVNPMARWKFDFHLDSGSRRPEHTSTSGAIHSLIFSAKITHGTLIGYYPQGRDQVMLPFPSLHRICPFTLAAEARCLIACGAVIAVNRTRVEGADGARSHRDNLRLGIDCSRHAHRCGPGSSHSFDSGDSAAIGGVTMTGVVTDRKNSVKLHLVQRSVRHADSWRDIIRMIDANVRAIVATDGPRRNSDAIAFRLAQVH